MLLPSFLLWITLDCFEYSVPISVCLSSLVFVVGCVVAALTHAFGIAHQILMFTLSCLCLPSKLMITVWAHTFGVMLLICVFAVYDFLFVCSFGSCIYLFDIFSLLIWTGSFILITTDLCYLKKNSKLRFIFRLWNPITILKSYSTFTDSVWFGVVVDIWVGSFALLWCILLSEDF